MDLFRRDAILDLRIFYEKLQPALIVRVHDSGDFFSEDYLLTWYRIALALPKVVFYAYTKMFAQLSPVMFELKPSNFSIVQSVGGIDDDKIDLTKPHSRVFVSHEDRIRAGYEDGTETDKPAILGVVKVGLVYHGSRGLKPGQKAALAVIE